MQQIRAENHYKNKIQNDIASSSIVVSTEHNRQHTNDRYIGTQHCKLAIRVDERQQ